MLHCLYSSICLFLDSGHNVPIYNGDIRLQKFVVPSPKASPCQRVGLVYLVAVDSGVVLRLANIGGKKSLDISLDGYSIRLYLGKLKICRVVHSRSFL